MLEAFLTFINQQKLDLHKQSTLLTVSGGVDSIVLAHLFHLAGFRAGMAHCNFGLRDTESDADEIFVRELAAAYNFPFYVKRFSTKDHARIEGISTQMAARDLRYGWFEDIRKEKRYDWIATAHHAGDSFETVILNLVRGTGLAGLHGIAAQNKKLIRPLLFANREDIEKYVQRNQLTWREDSSNQSNHYKRNLIRHEVIPVFKKMNPSLEATFKTTSRRIASAENLLNDFLNEWKEKSARWDREGYYISIAALRPVSEPVYRLWFVLQDFGFSYAQTEEVYKAVEGISGKLFKSLTHQVLKDRDHFIVSKLKQESVMLPEISEPAGKYQIGNAGYHFQVLSKRFEFPFIADKTSAYLDLSKLLFPLTVRKWEAGDSFCPFGMGGKRKKVSDLLIDLKLNLNQKQQVNVLVNGNEDIVWVIGLRTDDRYRVDDNTTAVLMITPQPPASGF